MKSKVKFEIHLFANEVLALDVTVPLKHRKLRTTLFTQPADSDFYLSAYLANPSHIPKNLPK